MKLDSKIKKLIETQGLRLDLGCGPAKQEGFIGVDIRKLPGVDVVWDLEKFPYPFPDDCATLIMMSHMVEHFNPHSPSSITKNLVSLLLDKKIITPEEIEKYIGEVDPGPIFMRVMDEVWRLLRVDGKLMLSYPYAGSLGYWQDPTHVNGINEATWAYFDPEEPNSRGQLYRIYHPKPWRIELNSWSISGNMEVILVKREDKEEYKK